MFSHYKFDILHCHLPIQTLWMEKASKVFSFYLPLIEEQTHPSIPPFQLIKNRILYASTLTSDQQNRTKIDSKRQILCGAYIAQFVFRPNVSFYSIPWCTMRPLRIFVHYTAVHFVGVMARNEIVIYHHIWNMKLFNRLFKNSLFFHLCILDNKLRQSFTVMKMRLYRHESVDVLPRYLSLGWFKFLSKNQFHFKSIESFRLFMMPDFIPRIEQFNTTFTILFIIHISILIRSWNLSRDESLIGWPKHFDVIPSVWNIIAVAIWAKWYIGKIRVCIFGCVGVIHCFRSWCITFRDLTAVRSI